MSFKRTIEVNDKLPGDLIHVQFERQIGMLISREWINQSYEQCTVLLDDGSIHLSRVRCDGYDQWLIIKQTL